jgi:uncharacterized repeat protein (TIGR02543 family)
MRYCLALFVLLFALQTPANAARVELGTQITEGEAQELKNLLAADPTSGVIVGLKVRFQPEGTLTSSGITTQRAEIAQAAAALKTRLGAAIAADNIVAYKSIPFVWVRVTSEQVITLYNTGLVRTIQKDSVVRPMADTPVNPTRIFAVPSRTADDTPTIAIIGTGIDKTHPAIGTDKVILVDPECSSRVAGLCGVACPSTLPGCEVGTHMAGIAAGKSTVPGVASSAKLISLRVGIERNADFNNEVIGWESDITVSLETLLNNRTGVAAAVIGFSTDDVEQQRCDAQKLALKAAIDNLRSYGIATIAASGNSGAEGLASPACISSAISVGAVSGSAWGNCNFTSGDGFGVTAADKVSCNSNFSRDMSLLAPGVPITSSVLGGRTATRGGTAMAAAYVGGVWAVLRQVRPNASVSDVLGVLQATGVDVIVEDTDVSLKRVDIAAASARIANYEIIYERAGGEGRVSFGSTAGQCVESCVKTFNTIQTVTITATADPGYQFAGWSGACENTTGSCTVAVTHSRKVIATFAAAAQRQLLSYTKRGAAGELRVTYTSTSNELVTDVCTNDCSLTYPTGQSINLTATGTANQAFEQWLGDCDGTAPVCGLTMDGTKNVTAEFVPAYSLEVLKVSENQGDGRLECNGSACNPSYAVGKEIRITAIPAPGSELKSWQVDGSPMQCTGNSLTCIVTMNAAKSVTAVFVKKDYTLTLQPMVGGEMKCVVSNALVDCNQTYGARESVTIRAVPAPGYILTTWQVTGGLCVTRSVNCAVEMSVNRTVKAVFAQEVGLTIQSSNGSIKCDGTDCNPTYGLNEPVVLTASADEGWRVVSWVGCSPDSTNINRCSVTMDAAKTVTANYDIASGFRMLGVRKAGEGAGSFSVANREPRPCGAGCSDFSIPANTVVTVAAVETATSKFAGWQGCSGSANAPANCSVTMNVSRTVTATFDPAFSLTYGKEGAGNGSVSFSPGNNAPCTANCSAKIKAGTNIIITATPQNGSTVTWPNCTANGGTISSNGLSCSITMNAERTVTASFAPPPVYTLTYAKAGSGASSMAADGEVCLANSCTKSYNAGSTARLSVVSGRDGSSLTSWSVTGPQAEQCPGTGNASTCTVIMNANKTVTGTFTRVIPTVTLAITESGNGQVTCGSNSACAGSYPSGTVVNIAATPDAGWRFTGWGGDCAFAGTGNSCRLTMSDNRNISASFERLPAQTFALNITTPGNGSGQVRCDGGNCASSYASGTRVNLTAIAASDSQFTGWGGDCASAGTGICTVLMSGNRNVIANFIAISVTNHILSYERVGAAGSVSFDPANGAACTENCDKSYAEGTSVTLTANPAAGTVFAGWSANCVPSGPSSCKVTMDSAQRVTATFRTPDGLALTYQKITQGTGSGSVSILPRRASATICTDNCVLYYAPKTRLRITATPAVGSEFAGWGGACRGTKSCRVTMRAANSVTATFNTVPIFQLQLGVTGTGSVSFAAAAGTETCTADCTKGYSRNTKVNLTATPTGGSVFTGWTGACRGKKKCTIKMDAAKSVTAVFTTNAPTPLSYSQTGSGSVSIAVSRGATTDCSTDCATNIAMGARVTIKAKPAAGWIFVGWTGACTGTRDCKLTMTAATALAARFEKIPEYVLNYSSTGTGSVSIVPRGGTATTCAAACAPSFTSGTKLRLTATPAAGSVFTGWSGACSGKRVCSVTMDAAKTVTATFSTAQSAGLRR